MNTITFNASSKTFILDSFDKTLDKNNFIVEKFNKAQKVLSPDGQEVHLIDFAGIKKGSEIFIKKDLISLIQLCDSISR